MPILAGNKFILAPKAYKTQEALYFSTKMFYNLV